ncbi:MAG: hypothetical protein MJY89_00425 [Bacteroidales bacterium]|nr:hypothetical protein [Bacteroidales bacterium]
MLEEIKSNFQKLISLYETEKHRADSLEERLQTSEENVRAYKEQITDLNRQIDNLKLQAAFCGGGDNSAAKESITKLLREIDKCIKLLEN